MPDITITGLRVAPVTGPRIPTTWRAYGVTPGGFLLNDADNTAVSESSPYDQSVGAYKIGNLTSDGAGYAAADFSLPSTTDSIDKPNEAKWGLYVHDQNGRLMYPVAGLASFSLSTDSPQTVEDIVTFNLGSLPSETPRDVHITGDLEVDGNVSAASFTGSAAGLHDFPGGAVLVNNSIVAAGSAGINADSDGNGVGEAYLAVNSVTKFRARQDGLNTESLVPFILPGYVTGSLPTPATSHALAYDSIRRDLVLDVGQWAALGMSFDIRRFGAKLDNSTDDTGAVNVAIGKLNDAGGGILDFPPVGICTITSALDDIEVPFLVRGGGPAAVIPGGVVAPTLIKFTSATGKLFNISALAGGFENLALLNTNGSPTDGCAVNVAGSNAYQKIDLEGVYIQGFYDGIRQNGAMWSIKRCWIVPTVGGRYGLLIQNTVVADAGDPTIDGLWVTSSPEVPAAVKILSGGGVKISNLKVLGCENGIDVADANTGIIQVTNFQIELFTGIGFKAVGSLADGGHWHGIQLNQGRFLAAATNPHTHNPMEVTNISESIFDNLIFRSNASDDSLPGNLAAIGMANCANLRIGENIIAKRYGRRVQSAGNYVGRLLPDESPSALAVPVGGAIHPQHKTIHLSGGGNTLTDIFLAAAAMAPYDTECHRLNIIADDDFEWSDAGNIAGTGTATIGQMIVAEFSIGLDKKWHFSQ